MYLRNNRVGIIDLSTAEFSEEPLEEISGFDNFSAVRTCDGLSARHGRDALVLGTGVLTASFVPAACAGIIRGIKGQDGTSKTAPMLGFSGVELKLSGFDFVVIKGSAPSPGYVWIRDGSIVFVVSESIRSLDSWGRTDKIRADQGDAKIQVLSTGPFADTRHPCARLVSNYWAGEDKAGVGTDFGAKNLAAVAVRGMGELELAEPDKHFEDAFMLMREHIVRLGENKGLASYSDMAGRTDFQGLVHRHVSCYGCPFPCRSYLKISEDPKEFKLVAKEPGYLHYDIPSLQKAFEIGLDAKGATDVMIKCARAGIDPACVLAGASGEALRSSSLSVEQIISNPSTVGEAVVRNFEASFDDTSAYEDCLGMGLCPRYWSKVGFDRELVRSFAEPLLGKD
ncbi:MAG TPA: aldehyde ferredoxin oxidoreductase N-terminal domain-containing protein [Thermoplasmata archaeon]